MRYGFAISFATPDDVPQMNYNLLRALKDSGYDFVEITLKQISLLDDASFGELVHFLNEIQLDADCACSMFPPGLKLIGKSFDPKRLDEYLEKGFARLSRLGVKKQIFGSGMSRFLEPEMSSDAAMKALASVLRKHCVPLLEKYRIKLLVEPIRKKETNFINRLDEGAVLVRRLDHPMVALLADCMHMLDNGEAPECFLEHMDYIEHVHVSERERILPTSSFSTGLEAILKCVSVSGYDKTISLESSLSDGYESLGPALRHLKVFLRK
jgi:sugar phosphate isomerase/epimerase